jgi:hypothetical protein
MICDAWGRQVCVMVACVWVPWAMLMLFWDEVSFPGDAVGLACLSLPVWLAPTVDAIVLVRACVLA